MNDITLITPPDDILIDGFRILLVDVSRDQSGLITEVLKNLEKNVTVIIYVWTPNQTVEWLIDKKQKSDIIIFNAESENREIVGYMSAQNNAYYMGTLRPFEITNNRAIRDLDSCAFIFENFIGLYDKK